MQQWITGLRRQTGLFGSYAALMFAISALLDIKEFIKMALTLHKIS
jgi:hypothetical protein